jgi:hypothetical protein
MATPSTRRQLWPLVVILGALSSSMFAWSAQAACGLQDELPESYADLVRSGIHDGPVQTGPLESGTRGGYFDPTAAFHGQILLGENILYHLPMYMADPAAHPHNFQVILKIEMPSDAVERLRTDQRAHPDTLYTATPPPFAQRQLWSYPGHPHIASFDRVGIVRHHFERRTPPPIQIAETPMAIREVVHFRQLAPGREAPSELAYILVGTGEERYMAHLLSAPPDFDQLLKVRVDGTMDEETGPIFVTLGPRSNKVEDRLAVGEVVRCSGVKHTLRFTVEAEVYCEAGELAFTAGEGPFEPRDCLGQ